MKKAFIVVLIILFIVGSPVLAKKINIINNASAFNINLIVNGEGRPSYKETISTGRRVAQLPPFKAETMIIEVVNLNDKIKSSVEIDSSKTVDSIELSEAPDGNYALYPQLRVILAPKNS